MSHQLFTRRDALKTLVAGSAAAWILPARLRAAPSDQLRLAFIGAGGWAREAIGSLVGEHYVAFCDVDEARAAPIYSLFPNVPRYRDLRQMWDRHGKEIDAVVVTTPDHSHYPLAMHCLAERKHVYLEKPMATTPWECRRIAAAARAAGVTTQLGVQGHSAEGLRVLREWVEAGVVGPVQDVWFWTDRTHPRIAEWSESLADPAEVPSTLNWRAWLADRPDRPYSPRYLPQRWRNWWTFGSGAICDIGTHMFDVLRSTFDTEFPDVVTAEVSGRSAFTIPRWCNLEWEFPAKGGRGPLKVHWRNGWRERQQNLPEAIPHVPAEVLGKTTNGMAFIGTEGTLFIPDMRANRRPKIFPVEREREVLAAPPPKRLPRPKGGHFRDWLQAVREQRPASADFSYGAALTEQVLLGAIAQRIEGPLRWDAAAMRVDRVPEAEAFIRPPRRSDAWEPPAWLAPHLPG